MAQLSSEERIARVEQAPAEIQVRVAKAFLRDDIDDEDVQYLFNQDSLEELNDSAEESSVENINAEDPEGIGATGFTMRTTKPNNNKNFITTGSGGWSTCIKGYPTDSGANVLANCVGYASGRFNEIINIARDTSGCTYKTLNCNAVGFKERAEAAGLQTGSTPRRGAIMCWGKDGAAGHVAIVERVNSNNSVYTSESGYGSSTAFWNQTRTTSNGRWGMSSGYYFRCFIYLPSDVQNAIDGSTPTPEPTPTPVETWPKSYTVVSGDTLSGIANKFYGSGDYNHYMFIANANGISNPNVISVGKNLTIPEYTGYTPTPTPTPVVEDTLKVGDTVKIIGTGNGSSYGTSGTAYGIGWTRTVLKIWDGRKYPYQIGNKNATTGFYEASALQKL